VRLRPFRARTRPPGKKSSTAADTGRHPDESASVRERKCRGPALIPADGSTPASSIIREGGGGLADCAKQQKTTPPTQADTVVVGGPSGTDSRGLPRSRLRSMSSKVAPPLVDFRRGRRSHAFPGRRSRLWSARIVVVGRRRDGCRLLWSVPSSSWSSAATVSLSWSARSVVGVVVVAERLSLLGSCRRGRRGRADTVLRCRGRWPSWSYVVVGARSRCFRALRPTVGTTFGTLNFDPDATPRTFADRSQQRDRLYANTSPVRLGVPASTTPATRVPRSGTCRQLHERIASALGRTKSNPSPWSQCAVAFVPTSALSAVE